MKTKIQKKFFFKGMLISIIPIIAFCSSLILSNINKTNTLTINNVVVADQNHLDGGDISQNNLYSLGTVTETASSFSFLPLSEIPWANTKKADEISSEEIKSILVASNIGAIFHVQIKSVDLVNGIVSFDLNQQIRTFVDGNVVNVENQLITFAGGTTTWTTPQGLLILDKYNFAWRNNDQIGSFLRNTTLKPADLTIEIVLSELVSYGKGFKLPTSNNITLIVSDVSLNSSTLYGVVKIVIQFNNIVNNDWVNNSPPSLSDRTLILRGMKIDSGNPVEMNFSELVTSSSIGSIKISNKDIFGNVLLDNENSISDLYPSEFTSLIDKKEIFLFINMLQKGDYLENSTKLVDFTYMGSSINDANFSSITGIENSIISQLGLYNVIPTNNDLEGSLKLVYEYRTYDVYTNSIIQNSSFQTFETNTFKINSDINKTLVFNWKANSEVQELGSSFNIINNFHKTINNVNQSDLSKEEFIINYSNFFFIGSNDVYAKTDRIFSLNYKGGTKNVNGEYVPLSTTPSDFNQIEATIIFNSWNGHIYSDLENGINVKKDGIKYTATFSLSNYNYSGNSSVAWERNTSLSDLFNKLPSDIAYDISNNLISMSRFFSITGLSDIQTIILPNDLLGSINFKIIGNENGSKQVYQNVFTGFTTSKIGDNIIDFGWLPQIDLPKTITDKLLTEVTDQEIDTYLLENYPLLQNGIINFSDIKKIRDIDANVIYIQIEFNFFNQELAVPGNQTFYTKLVGFNKLSSEDIMELKEPLNLTIILSVGLGGIIGLPLLIYFIVILTKYSIYAKNKKSSTEKKGARK